MRVARLAMKRLCAASTRMLRRATPGRQASASAAGVAAAAVATLYASSIACEETKPRSKSPAVISVKPVGSASLAASGEDLISMLRYTTQCATITSQQHHPNLVVVDSPAIRGLFTMIRDKDLEPARFAPAANRLMNMLAELGLGFAASVQPKTVETPCGVYHGVRLLTEKDIVVVSIVRGGDALQTAVSKIIPGAPVGKILIQRDETTDEKKPILLYQKLPDLGSRTVVLTDPMLATGGSAIRAIKQLLEAGAKEDQILFLTVVSSPEGLRRLGKEYPSIRVVTCAVDSHLNEHKYIVPGLGDFGDRYYGTI